MKKLFIKICKLLGFEILDQNNFYSPTLEKNLNEELSIINEKSIILPLGQVKITKKVSSILIIFRMNTDVEIWDQSRKRLFELPKIEYSKRSINSLIKAIEYFKAAAASASAPLSSSPSSGGSAPSRSKMADAWCIGGGGGGGFSAAARATGSAAGSYGGGGGRSSAASSRAKTSSQRPRILRAAERSLGVGCRLTMTMGGRRGCCHMNLYDCSTFRLEPTKMHRSAAAASACARASVAPCTFSPK